MTGTGDPVDSGDGSAQDNGLEPEAADAVLVDPAVVSVARWRDCEASGYQVAADREAARRGRQVAWARFVRSALGVVGVLFAVWTTQIHAHPALACTPSIGCFKGAEDLSRLGVVLLFFVGTLLELFCLNSPPEKRYADALDLAARLRSQTWVWIMYSGRNLTTRDQMDRQEREARLVDYKETYIVAVKAILAGFIPVEAPGDRDLYLPAQAVDLLALPEAERRAVYCARLSELKSAYMLACSRTVRSRRRLMTCMVLLCLVGSMFAVVSMLYRDLDTSLLGIIGAFLTGRAATLAAHDPSTPGALATTAGALEEHLLNLSSCRQAQELEAGWFEQIENAISTASRLPRTGNSHSRRMTFLYRDMLPTGRSWMSKKS